MPPQYFNEAEAAPDAALREALRKFVEFCEIEVP